ncbi:MAG TPA: putative lipid II flippase FtsW [Gammaproteobacteria bacterium]|nr:putative lipid II flippase FtsW [Gammaproteobacteria bacterium]
MTAALPMENVAPLLRTTPSPPSPARWLAYRDHDPWILGTAVMLVAIGLVMMTSASITLADKNYGDPFYFLRRQMIALGIGVALALWAMHVPLHFLQRVSSGFLLLGILVLFLVLIPGIGREVNGSLRWLQLGPLSMQASEIAKPCIVLYLAGYLVRHHDQVREKFIGFIKPIGVLTLIAGLLLLEPDYGAAAVLFATCLGMLFLAGVSLLRFISWGLVAVAALAALAMLAPYRLARLMAFVNPWADPYDTGFQLTQSLIAFGRGELTGVGLGAGIQKLFYLPEVHTDFVFAVIGEELGLAGTLAVIALFLFLVWRMLLLGGEALKAGQAFHAHIANGVALLLGLQAFINIGVNMGVLPTKGLTLPLISYGANSMVITWVMIGLLLRVAHEIRQPARVLALTQAQTTSVPAMMAGENSA